jgi:hypothetical protein
MERHWLQLVWQDGERRIEEGFGYEDVTLGDALRKAYRDGLACSYGRRFIGFAGDHASVDLASVDPLPPPAGTEGVLPAIDQVRWWDHTSCFGTGTTVGADLRLCAAMDPEVSRDAALRVYGATLQGGQVYPVTALAIPFAMQLLERRGLHSRAVLKDWLKRLRQSVSETVNASPQKLERSRLAVLHSFPSIPEIGASLAESVESHGQSARACAPVLAQYRWRPFRRLGSN